MASNPTHAGNATKPSVVVFGATGGIGFNLCSRLVAKGWNVLGVGRNEEKLRLLGTSIPGVETVCIDESRGKGGEGYRWAAEVAVERFGALSGMVNCIGSLLLKPAHLTTDKEWVDVLHTNLSTAFHTVQAAAHLLTQGGGSVVLVSSSAARVGIANHEAIAAAKAGVIGLTLSAAATYASRGLRFNCVAPGLVATPMTAPITSTEKSRQFSTAMHALGRIGEPSDVASAIEWLLDPAQSWITGQVIGVDGGLGSVISRRAG
jgi:NAD(P)-dependent dehydrogenase (short-subunit alcohol dehydrogenase family)